MDSTKPSIGLSTQAGLGTSGAITLAGVIDALASGSVDQDQWRAWLIAAAIFIVTQAGRYLQAAQAAQGVAQARALVAAKAAVTDAPAPVETSEALPSDDDEDMGPPPPPDTAAIPVDAEA